MFDNFRAWLDEFLHPVPKAADVLHLFSTVASLPPPEVSGMKYSRPCLIAQLHDDGRLEVLGSPVVLRFEDQQWVKDSVGHECITYPATHWQFMPQ